MSYLSILKLINHFPLGFICIISFSFFFTLQHCIGFAIHWHESPMGVHVSSILNPPPTSLPIPFTNPESVSHPSALTPSILYHTSNLDWQFISHMIIYMFQCILPYHPTLALSHRVQKTVQYICVSLAVLHTGLSLPSF